jgi:hypothetical protein
LPDSNCWKKYPNLRRRKYKYRYCRAPKAGVNTELVAGLERIRIARLRHYAGTASIFDYVITGRSNISGNYNGSDGQTAGTT